MTEPDTPKTISVISKAALVRKLLARTKGGTRSELAAETGWQPHSVRAHLSRLRKTRHQLERISRKTGETAWRLVMIAEEAGTHEIA